MRTNGSGAFVKLGQVLGARADALPAALIGPLRGLHDRVPPRLFGKLRDHVEAELGKPLTEVFSSVDEQPIAPTFLFDQFCEDIQVIASSPSVVGGPRMS